MSLPEAVTHSLFIKVPENKFSKKHARIFPFLKLQELILGKKNNLIVKMGYFGQLSDLGQNFAI